MISDYIFTSNPTHPILMSLVTIVIAMVGYGLAKSYRYYTKASNEGLLEAPPDLGFDKECNNGEEQKTHVRYTKSQARQRYRKGKM